MKKLFALAALFFALIGPVQAQQVNLYCATGTGFTTWQPASAAFPCPVAATATIVFPTIGAAVPATGIYDAINVAGTLRGWSGLSTGSIFPGAVAIVDASGTQITTFGTPGGATAANQSTEITSLATIATNTAAAIPTQAPTVSIGGVGIIDSAGTNVATVKAASTIPVATDKTLVVGLNPGTSVAGTPTGAILTVQGVASMTPIAISGSLTANQSVNVAQINGVTPLMGNGVTGTGSQRVTIASDNTAFSVNASLTAATAGGATSYYVQPTASDNHVNIKNGAGTAYSIHFTNNSATKNYMRLYDAGTGFNGCNSATGLIFGMEIPPTDSGISVSLGGSVGLAFSTGLSICVTSGYGSTDTTNATATAMMGNVLYK